GGGNATLRRQLGALKKFIDKFDFIRLRPDNSILKSTVPEGARVHALVEPGKQYALYIFGGRQVTLALELPGGIYQFRWLNPMTGSVDKRGTLTHPGGVATLASPAYTEDIALRLVR